MNNNDWKQCFEQYQALALGTRQILRSCAVTRLVKSGVDEIGSSDLNHELFAMWRTGEEDWYQAIINEVNCS